MQRYIIIYEYKSSLRSAVRETIRMTTSLDKAMDSFNAYHSTLKPPSNCKLLVEETRIKNLEALLS